MMDKGHCRFDIASRDAEFRDFFEGAPRSEEERDDEGFGAQTDNASLRLPSGKILSHRAAPQPRHHRPLPRQAGSGDGLAARLSPARSAGSSSSGPGAAAHTGAAADSSPARPDPEKTQLTKRERREIAMVNELAHLSVGDRTALAYLAPAEQRAVLATRKRQAARRYERRVEGLGNKTLMKHFAPDTPGRTNGSVKRSRPDHRLIGGDEKATGIVYVCLWA